MEFELPKDNPSIIKVIGVGGGGSNAVNHMYRQGIKGVDFIVCNTDHQALEMSPVPTKIQLGTSLTEGRGAGSIPEVGKNAAIENADDIRKFLEKNTKMVFITAGMGGGTGTGAAPVIAGIARELGILTVGIVTMPFGFEGRKRELQAKEGLEQLKKSVDTLLIIKNDKLREIHGNLKLNEAFAQADNVLSTAAKSIAEIITKTYYMNVDFADVFTVMNNSGVAIMGSATATGPERAMIAVRNALESPLLNDNNIEGARYILLNIVSGTGDNEVTMDEFDEITSYVQEAAGYSADLINGSGFDEELGDRLLVTIIATGFKTSQEIGLEKKTVERIVRVLDEKPKEELPVPQPPVAEAPGIKPVAAVEERKPEEEMKLIQKPEEPQPQRSIEFEISKPREPYAAAPPVPSVPPAPVKIAERVTEPVRIEYRAPEPPPQAMAAQESDEIAEQLRRSKERIMRLKEISIKIKSPGGLTDLEKVPAYVRKNIRLDNDASSGESQISRYTLSEDENGKPEIRPNNSFLHDNVD
jgi:cell division protein FtsZ